MPWLRILAAPLAVILAMIAVFAVLVSLYGCDSTVENYLVIRELYEQHKQAERWEEAYKFTGTPDLQASFPQYICNAHGRCGYWLSPNPDDTYSTCAFNALRRRSDNPKAASARVESMKGLP